MTWLSKTNLISYHLTELAAKLSVLVFNHIDKIYAVFNWKNSMQKAQKKSHFTGL